jgi:hypothetical protein
VSPALLVLVTQARLETYRQVLHISIADDHGLAFNRGATSDDVLNQKTVFSAYESKYRGQLTGHYRTLQVGWNSGVEFLCGLFPANGGND